MERFFKDPRTIRKFRTGPLGLNIQQLADELFHLGYTRPSIRVRIQALARFGCWLKKCRIPLQDLTLAHTKAYVDRQGTVKNGDGKLLRMLLETDFYLNQFSHPLMTVEPQALLVNSRITSDNSAVWLQGRSRITALTW